VTIVEATKLTTVRERNGKIIANLGNCSLRDNQNWAFNQILSRQDDWTKKVAEWIWNSSLHAVNDRRKRAAWILFENDRLVECKKHI